jgi:hypothetical protein
MFHQERLDGDWSMDMLIGHIKSKDGNTCAQVFVNNKEYFAVLYPMELKGKAEDAHKVLCAEFGVLEWLIFDGSKEQTKPGTEFMKQVHQHNIDYCVTKLEWHNQNPAEGVIHEMWKNWFCIMVPRCLWDYRM